MASEPRFVPYLQRHEFEAPVIADSDALKTVFPNHSAQIDVLAAIHGYEMSKPDHALFVLQQADMPKIRLACPRFNAWLYQWENWGHDSNAV